MKWYAPRATDANLVMNEKGETEHYLFYRGLANFALPIEVKFIDSMHLSIKNNSTMRVPFIYVYDHADQNTVGIWATGPIAAGEVRLLNRPDHYTQGTDIGLADQEAFKAALASSNAENAARRRY